jgi:hypothetical protein
MRFLEAIASALVVACLVALVAWRNDVDMVTVPTVAALVTFLAVLLRSSGRAGHLGRTPSLRRRPGRRARLR